MQAIKLNKPTLSAYNQLLVYRIFFEFGKLSSFFVRPNRWDDDELADSLGIPMEYEEDEDNRSALKQVLKQRFSELSQNPMVDEDSALAEQNIEQVVKCLQLNDTEHAILKFTYYIHNETSVYPAVRYLGRSINRQKFISKLAKIIDKHLDAVRLALQKNSKLFSFGLIESRPASPHRDFEDHLLWGDTISIDELSFSVFNDDTLLKSCLQITEPSKLSEENFAHIESMRERILRYLRNAYKSEQIGVNILIYGVPGTGKTEFVSWIAQALNVPSYTLRYADEDDAGVMHSNKNRLTNCTLAQALIKQKQALMIFDEIEDVFSGSFFLPSIAQEHKAWVNHFLENNPVPMVWISNDVSCMDDAFLRRYDIVFKMPDLPIQHKELLIRKLSDNQLNDAQVLSLAKQEHLPAAVLERGFKVAKTVSEDSQAFAQHAISIFNETLVAQGKCKLQLPKRQNASFSLDWVSCHGDIHKISHGLIKRQSGRVCCYGPAGTGKTAWANWLGEQMNMPVLLKQGSDLLGKFVGETEQRIAQAFEQAIEQNMLLVLDEVDTFLFSREHAQKSWERSMVNEMLTQMERFEGILIVSTNMMDNIDAAALRRFDLKLNFDFLTTTQISRLAIVQAELLNLPELSINHIKRLQSIEYLTPGDFNAVFRQHQFAEFETPDDWIEALTEECKLKPIAKSKSIGFLANFCKRIKK